jgi:lipopolysaccharide transport system ATP-binding protein
MNRGPVVVAGNVGKFYRRYSSDHPWTLQDFLFSLHRRAEPQGLWAIRNVTFELSPGTMLGVIGRNGAGKSTLLRLIGGLLKPDEGELQVHGRVSGILELGAGVHADLTGRENIYIAGVVGGLKRQEVRARFDEIVDFAELGSFIDRPLRSYSKGMQMRLAFAVAVHVRPDLLLVDEVLAVGDTQFQKKCLDRIAEIKKNGCAIVVVSHDVQMVAALCEQAILLKQGRLEQAGDPEAVVSTYLESADRSEFVMSSPGS